MSNIITDIQVSGVTYTLSAETSGGTVDQTIESGSTNAVAGGAVYDKFDEVEQVTARALNDLNEKKQDVLSAGTNITISGNVISATGGGGGNPTVELTQAEYDALVSAGTVSADTFYIITDATAFDPSTKVDTSAFTTYSAATNTALNNKVDKSAVVSSVTSASTDSEIPTAKAVWEAASGGGTTYTAGRGIDITNDTISFSLPISANTDNSIVMGGKINNLFTNNGRDCLMVGSEDTISNGSDFCLLVGYRCSANGDGSAVIGYRSMATGDTSFAFGYDVSATTSYSFATGYGTITKNNYEHTSGEYNVSNTGSTTADKTLFSVGNGTSKSARHNAFEIRQNGDIYLSLNGQDVKLQDQLGGSSITVDTALDSGSTNPVENRVIYNKIDEVEQVTAAGLNAVNDKFDGLKLKKLTQVEYDALSGSTDANTLYVIVN